MAPRFDYAGLAPKLFERYMAFTEALQDCSLEPSLRDLVMLRASQMNGCAFCVDMHAKEATIHGERPLRLHHLAVWRESPLFTARERATLAWTEALTGRADSEEIDTLFPHISAELRDDEIAALTFLIMAINGWNIANAAVQNTPGSMDALLGLEAAGLT